MPRIAGVVAVVLLCSAAHLHIAMPVAATAVEVTERASVSTSGSEGNGRSEFPAISGDGGLVAFYSPATNLVPGDTNDVGDVFVRYRHDGTTARVSVGPGGLQANGSSWEPAFSRDGRYVAFSSVASNLVVGDTNGRRDVFMHDRLTAQTTRLSMSSTGGQGSHDSSAPAVSMNGRYVAFESRASNLVTADTNAVSDVFVHDRLTAQTTRVSVDSSGNQADDGSRWAAISDDGRFVAFSSWASNLVAGKTGHMLEVLVHDRDTGTTARVSQDTTGGQADGSSLFPALSTDGRYVTFHSRATDLVVGDTNGAWDVFVHDRLTVQTTRVSVDSSGAQGSGDSAVMTISADGRFVAFDSQATNLVSADTNNTRDCFVHDRLTGRTARVSVASSGLQSNGWSQFPAISGDGRFVAFDSLATNLVSGDANGVRDVFVRWVSEPPGAPVLMAPEPYGRFDLHEQQTFTVRAIDPEGDAYHGAVTVTDRASGEVVTRFATATVASGVDSSGDPPTKLPPGEYEWTAIAVDEFGATGPASAVGVFGVVVQPNRPPTTPVLLEPTDGSSFLFGQPEVFSLVAADADNDLYSAIVTVTNVANGDSTTFQTRLAPSGAESRGRPVSPLLPGSYRWQAQAIDFRGETSSVSTTHTFEVTAGESLLIL